MEVDILFMQAHRCAMSVPEAEHEPSLLEICQEMVEAAKADDLPRVNAASAAYWTARRRESVEAPPILQ